MFYFWFGRRFEVDAPAEIVAWNCNCSICNMKKNWHFMVPKSRLRLLKGEDCLTTYRFNTKVAQVRPALLCCTTRLDWVEQMLCCVCVHPCVGGVSSSVCLWVPAHVLQGVWCPVLLFPQVEPRWLGCDPGVSRRRHRHQGDHQERTYMHVCYNTTRSKLPHSCVPTVLPTV